MKKSKACEKLNFFKDIIDSLHNNGRVDSGTKIKFLKLLKDLTEFNYSKLRRPPMPPRRIFLMKVIKLKFDLKLCSLKEFCTYLNNIDNCAIKYIEHINDCKIYIRDTDDLTIRHFLGEIDATIEGENHNDLSRVETALKRLADAVHYRLMKKMPTASTSMHGVRERLTLTNFPVLLQSPTTSTPDEEQNSFLPKLMLKDDSINQSTDKSFYLEKPFRKLFTNSSQNIFI